MNNLRRLIKEKKNLWLFVAIILLFGITIGVYFGFNAQSTANSLLTNYANSLTTETINFTIPHFTILALLFVLSFLGIGIPLAISYIFYEGLSIGFCFTIFLSSFGFKGLTFISIFFILTKIPFLFLFFFYLSKIIKITKSIIEWIFTKKNPKDTIVRTSLSCLILIITLLIYDLSIDFIGIKFIQTLQFLLT